MEEQTKTKVVVSANPECQDQLVDLTSFLQKSLDGKEGGIPLSDREKFLQEFDDRNCRLKDCVQATKGSMEVRSEIIHEKVVIGQKEPPKLEKNGQKEIQEKAEEG